MIIFRCDKCDLQVSFRRYYFKSENDYPEINLTRAEQETLREVIPFNGSIGNDQVILCKKHYDAYLEINNKLIKEKDENLKKFLNE